jgi:hypothetical protein
MNDADVSVKQRFGRKTRRKTYNKVEVGPGGHDQRFALHARQRSLVRAAVQSFSARIASRRRNVRMLPLTQSSSGSAFRSRFSEGTYRPGQR